MAAPYNPPVKNEDFVFAIALEDTASPGRFKSSPTIAAGDFKVDIDGGGFNNLTTLPTASGVKVTITLSAAEMNGDVITVTGIDQTATAEWSDFMICIPTTSA